MARFMTQTSAILLVMVLIASTAAAIVEPKTDKEYPDGVEQEYWGDPVALVVTGVGVREKTFMKVDVYTIVSYVKDGVDLGDDPAAALLKLDEPKRLQMDLVRGFSCDKLKNAFSEVIEKNYDDQSAFQADLDTFLAYFEKDAEDGDILVFDYCPGIGVITTLNGEEKGKIDNTAFMEALWTVWFGKEPANKGLREDLLSVFAE